MVSATKNDAVKGTKMRIRDALNLTGWLLLPIYGGFLGWLTYALMSGC
jgi:hypothetical protein